MTSLNVVPLSEIVFSGSATNDICLVEMSPSSSLSCQYPICWFPMLLVSLLLSHVFLILPWSAVMELTAAIVKVCCWLASVLSGLAYEVDDVDGVPWC